MLGAMSPWARVAVTAGLLATLGGCGDDRDPPADAAVAPGPMLCVFDYDLTLSSHACPATDARAGYHCRVTGCATYGWHEQCLGLDAQAAIASCVARGAYVGIASHADVDACWVDKVTPIVSEAQFPAWTSSPRYAARDADWHYPALDDRAHWNCADCPYTMEGGLPKPEGIARVMRAFGLDPAAAADRARVLFWDDEPANIAAVTATMPEVTTVLVPRNGATGEAGGCGITQREIDAGWDRARGAR